MDVALPWPGTRKRDPSAFPTRSPSAHSVRTAVALTPEDVDTLFAAHYTSLCKGVYRMYRDQALAEDVVQEAFLKLHRNLEKVERETVVGWLRKVAVNQAKDILEREFASRLRVDRAVRVGFLPGQDQGHRQIDEAVDNWDVLAAIAGLPADQREVVIAHYYWDLPDKEIANVLGLSATNVRQRLSRARKALKSTLEGR